MPEKETAKDTKTPFGALGALGVLVVKVFAVPFTLCVLCDLCGKEVALQDQAPLDGNVHSLAASHMASTFSPFMVRTPWCELATM